MGTDKAMHFKKDACDRHCPKEWNEDDQNPGKCNLHENLDWDDFISRRKRMDISKDFKFEKALCRGVGNSLCFKSMVEQQKATDLHWNQGDSGQTSVKSSNSKHIEAVEVVICLEFSPQKTSENRLNKLLFKTIQMYFLKARLLNAIPYQSLFWCF